MMTRIQTYRDIKNSLDVARRQQVPSITSSIEESLKAELEADFGPILTDEECSDILTKEKERKEKQDSALRKSRMNILKVKAKAKETQRVRDDLREGKIPGDRTIDTGNRKTLKSEGSGEESSEAGFKKINIGY
jgi:hypothetical protein